MKLTITIDLTLEKGDDPAGITRAVRDGVRSKLGFFPDEIAFAVEDD